MRIYLSVFFCLALFFWEPVFSQADFGGSRHEIMVDGNRGFCDEPVTTLENNIKPWVWYAPTIGNYPNGSNAWLLSQLIEEGFWVCGMDVGESNGAPAGRELFNGFFDSVVTRLSLDSQVVLIPQSRGGLMLYNWAADGDNALKVARIAGIYPVGDLNSWPGLEQAAPPYGLTANALADELEEHNPVDRLQPLFEAGVKIQHIHGDNDVVVPLSENSQVIYDRYTALGGDMNLIVVPDRGHAEIPEFFENSEMLEFVMARLNSDTGTVSIRNRNISPYGNIAIESYGGVFTLPQLRALADMNGLEVFDARGKNQNNFNFLNGFYRVRISEGEVGNIFIMN